MAKRKDRIIIDTNLWLSFLLTKNYTKLDKIFSENAATILFSQELIEEFIEVANRPKFKKYFTPEDLAQILEHIRLQMEFIEVTSTTDLCRDAKDNFLLCLAKDGAATHLITGDKDLLTLRRFGRTVILTMREYLKDNI
jgi:putative PIN family toxin of toxin-antitoxin system